MKGLKGEDFEVLRFYDVLVGQGCKLWLGRETQVEKLKGGP